MNDDRYKQIMADIGMPDSRSLLLALRQVANETAQELRASWGGGVDAVACDASVEVRCPTCKTFIGHHFYGDAAKDFFKNELATWDLLDEVEGYRRGIALTHVGQDPVEFFRDKWSGLISREAVARSIDQINIALKSKAIKENLND